METAFPAVRTLPAATLARAAPPELGLLPKCEVPQKLLRPTQALNSACSLLGRAERHQPGKAQPHAAANAPATCRNKIRNKIPVEDPREALGRKVATFLHRTLFSLAANFNTVL